MWSAPHTLTCRQYILMATPPKEVPLPLSPSFILSHMQVVNPGGSSDNEEDHRNRGHHGDRDLGP